MKQNTERACRHMAEAEGLSVVEIGKTGQGRHRLTLKNKQGDERAFVMPSGKADPRGLLNLRAALRRFATGRQAEHHAHEHHAHA